MGIDNHIYGQYSKLEGKELELFQKKIINESKKHTDLLVLLELTFEDVVLSDEKLEELKFLIDNNTQIWTSLNKLNVVVNAHLEKSQYSLVKKWLFDLGIRISTDNRFFVTKTNLK